MLYLGFENIIFMFLLLLSELLHKYKLHIKIKNTKIFCFCFLIVCFKMLYWIALMNDMIIAICFQLISENMNDYIFYDHLIKPRNTPVLFLRPPYFWRILNKMARKSRNRRTFLKMRRTFMQKSLQKMKQTHILTYMIYMRLLEYDYVLITYLTNLLTFHLMFVHLLAILAMGQNNRLGKKLDWRIAVDGLMN